MSFDGDFTLQPITLPLFFSTVGTTSSMLAESNMLPDLFIPSMCIHVVPPETTPQLYVPIARLSSPVLTVNSLRDMMCPL